MAREKEEAERQIAVERDKRKVKGPLDPLTSTLLSFEDEEAMEGKIADIYKVLDEDESGGLNFEEFRDGVKTISDKIHLTQDDFDIITENGKHLGPTAEFNSAQFQEMMKGELWRYEARYATDMHACTYINDIRACMRACIGTRGASWPTCYIYLSRSIYLSI